MKKRISKYELYEASVIDPKSDVKVFRKFYRDTFGKFPFTYREDFCGTFVHSTEWVKLHPQNKAWAIDLASAPIQYGMKTHYAKLSKDQQSRVKVLKRNVLSPLPIKADLITATNFSYFCLKERDQLKKYFSNVYKSLKPNGLFLIDVMGGSDMMLANTESSRIDWGKGKSKLFYFWEQKNFDAITHEAKFSIHFSFGNTKRKVRDVFTYDWRMWSIPELREIMLEVGFKRADVYWEGSQRTPNGEGNGVFTRKENEESCEVWIAYLGGVKPKK